MAQRHVGPDRGMRPMRRGMPSIQLCTRDRVVSRRLVARPTAHKAAEDAIQALRPAPHDSAGARLGRCIPRATGRWPTCSSGPCLEAPGEHWGSLISAIHEGQRGLPGGTTFAQLLVKHRGHRSKGHAPRLSIPQILAWALAFQTRHGKWPTFRSGPVADAPGETWCGIQSALGVAAAGCRAGHRSRACAESSAARTPRGRIRRARKPWITLELVSRCSSRPSRWRRQGVASSPRTLLISRHVLRPRSDQARSLPAADRLCRTGLVTRSVQIEGFNLS